MNARMYPRTTNQAFPRTAAYATAVECVYLPLWKRMVIALWRWS